VAEEPLYQTIAETIRRQIMQGEVKAGERLPPVREMAARWGCTLGTVQRAYRELSDQGLVTSRAGQGTRVIGKLSPETETPLRRASLIHRAEAFLLEVLTAGFTPAEVENAVRQALDRWRTVAQEEHQPISGTLRFKGSHDLALIWLGSHFEEIAPGYTMEITFSGSLGGLIALAEGSADLAGCHLWDEETNTYNAPFVRRLLPGVRVALITLAHRKIGLIVPPSNPFDLHDLTDLVHPRLRFVNRQPGSGTRVWLDASLHKLGIDPQNIPGYDQTRLTHTEVARAIAGGDADAGLGLQAAAHTYGLDFIPLVQDRYDLVIPAANLEHPAIQALVAYLSTPDARIAISSLAGYQDQETGKLHWVE
jgi:molybdate-binding protein/DNA-binding transcriptional regulator YhcF (GntR family)